jgi:hypothetical protein
MDKRFKEIILKCQVARKKYCFDYEEKYKDKINEFSFEIKNNKLIDKCEDKHFAKQLCIMNSLSYK